MSDDATLARIVAFTRALDDRRAEELVPFGFGTALFNRSLPRLWDWNHLRLEREGATADELAAEADRLQGAAGFKHRKVTVDGEAEGRRLAPEFERLGWRAQRLLVMVHRREPDRAPDVSLVTQVDEPALRGARAAATRSAPWGDEETLRQVLLAKRVRAEIADVRWFAARVDGLPASYCELYSDGRTAQIEDVLTLPEHRGRGLGAAVVLRALDVARAEGHDLVFLTADESDWPKELYTKLGFDAVGRFYAFLRTP